MLRVHAHQIDLAGMDSFTRMRCPSACVHQVDLALEQKVQWTG
jgi:hypothetical protein